MGFVNLVVMMGQTILLVPVLLHFWGGETYGIWLSVIALGMMFTTFDTGHQQYLLNRFNMRYPTVGAVGVKQDIADGLRMAMVLGGAQALLALILTFCGSSARVFGLEPEGGLISVANAAFLTFVLSWWIRGSVSGILAKLYVTRGDYTQVNCGLFGINDTFGDDYMLCGIRGRCIYYDDCLLFDLDG